MSEKKGGLPEWYPVWFRSHRGQATLRLRTCRRYSEWRI